MWCNAVNHYQNSPYSEGLPEDKGWADRAWPCTTL